MLLLLHLARLLALVEVLDFLPMHAQVGGRLAGPVASDIHVVRGASGR